MVERESFESEPLSFEAFRRCAGPLIASAIPAKLRGDARDEASRVASLTVVMYPEALAYLRDERSDGDLGAFIVHRAPGLYAELNPECERGDVLDLPGDGLARRLLCGDEEARAEVVRRFRPITRDHARDVCSRLGHRRGRCPGETCGEAYHPVRDDLEERIAGRPASSPEGPRASLFVTWYRFVQTHPSWAGVGFSEYFNKQVKKRGMYEEGLRVWNVARGLPARFRLGKRHEDGPARYSWLLDVNADAGAAARELGLEDGDGLRRILEALWRDACQTGEVDEIDTARVTRRLVPKRANEPGVEQAVGYLAGRIDTLAAALWPDWYDEYLARPRGMTRRPPEFDDHGDGGRRRNWE